jgi:beta-alanine degradation protein BauB
MHNRSDHGMRATAHVQVENDWVKVTEWRFAPGAETGRHVHAHDYVVVPLTSGVLRLEEHAARRETQLNSGVAYAREKGVEHNVVNANDFEFRFLEIEMLRPRVVR